MSDPIITQVATPYRMPGLNEYIAGSTGDNWMIRNQVYLYMSYINFTKLSSKCTRSVIMINIGNSKVMGDNII